MVSQGDGIDNTNLPFVTLGLTLHHTLEERHFFPILAKHGVKSFQDDEVHLKSHEAIHHGTDAHCSRFRGSRLSNALVVVMDAGANKSKACC